MARRRSSSQRHSSLQTRWTLTNDRLQYAGDSQHQLCDGLRPLILNNCWRSTLTCSEWYRCMQRVPEQDMRLTKQNKRFLRSRSEQKLSCLCG